MLAGRRPRMAHHACQASLHGAAASAGAAAAKYLGTSPADAHAEGRLGFGFSAGGLLFPYFVGIAIALRDQLGVIKPDTPVAGAPPPIPLLSLPFLPPIL
eukprot:193337-Chlamydomonas_euryale.AAC.1